MWRVATSTVMIALVLGACGPRTEPEGATVADPTAVPLATAADEVEENDEVAPSNEVAPLSEEELDAMERAEIEAACYAGSTAACDRLGH